MPTTSPEKVVTPAPADAYALTADLARMGASITQVVKVANATERAAVLAARIAAARPATTADPLIVRQQDTKEYLEHDGTGWAAVGGPEQAGAVGYGSGWRTPTTQPGAPITLVKRGKEVTLRGGMFENAVTIALVATGQNAGALTLPAGFFPQDRVIVPAFITITSVSNLLGAIIIQTDGSVTFQTAGTIPTSAAGIVSVAVGGASWKTA